MRHLSVLFLAVIGMTMAAPAPAPASTRPSLRGDPISHPIPAPRPRFTRVFVRAAESDSLDYPTATTTSDLDTNTLAKRKDKSFEDYFLEDLDYPKDTTRRDLDTDTLAKRKDKSFEDYFLEDLDYPKDTTRRDLDTNTLAKRKHKNFDHYVKDNLDRLEREFKKLRWNTQLEVELAVKHGWVRYTRAMFEAYNQVKSDFKAIRHLMKENSGLKKPVTQLTVDEFHIAMDNMKDSWITLLQETSHWIKRAKGTQALVDKMSKKKTKLERDFVDVMRLYAEHLPHPYGRRLFDAYDGLPGTKRSPPFADMYEEKRDVSAGEGTTTPPFN